MTEDLLITRGDLITPESVRVPKAKELVRLLASAANPFARLVECRREVDTETLVIEVEVELPQRKRIHDIRRFERVAVIFDPNDEIMPEVLALRADFPHVPHLNLRSSELPRSLCLYDQPYYELKIHWTAASFLERIRTWLALTAKGQLHADDQPLEPLLLDPGPDIILPSDLLSAELLQDPQPLVVRRAEGGVSGITLIAERWETLKNDKQYRPTSVVATIMGEAQPHGIIRRTPQSLFELHEFLAPSGTNLLAEVRARLKGWKERLDLGFRDYVRSALLVLVVVLPKTRYSGGPVEATELRAFIFSEPVERIGEEIGIWEVKGGDIGLLLADDLSKNGASLQIALLNPRFSLSRSSAAFLNGYEATDRTKIAAIGVGALGSQVTMNLIRAGFGDWTLIDKDKLLPHNLTRHGLDGYAVGFPKAESLAHVGNRIIDDKLVSEAIVVDVLRPGAQIDRLNEALNNSEVILDMSASVPVARYLARDVAAPARRISLFLNPSGTGLTILAEDQRRQIPLDMLEMQLYRELAWNLSLAGYLAHRVGQVRYGQSCRDITTRIPQDLVALNAVLGSRALRRAAQTDEATIALWMVDEQDLTVNCIRVDSSDVVSERIGDWTLCTDNRLKSKLAELRHQKLPKETGGVLIGSFDLQRKIVYVIDTLPSPPDSEEWPTLYIRGCEGLTRQVHQIEEATDGMLEYVGEWHSHPDGYGVFPSSDDLTVLGWLAVRMDAGGFPAVMLIVGEGGEMNPLFGGILAGKED